METRPTTISKVIAFELGLLIAVLIWIAFAGIPGMKPREVAEAEEPDDSSLANVSPIYQPTQSRRRAPVNYPADDAQVAQTGAQNPVATVQTYDPGLTAGGYGDTVDPSGQLSYGYDQPEVDGYIANQDPADSIGIFPEPVLDLPYSNYSPFGYSQPLQIVILNNNRTFAIRHRTVRCNFPRGTVSAPRRNTRATPPVQGGRGVTGPSVGPAPRVNPGNGNSAPRRSAPVRTAGSGQTGQARWNP